MKSTTTLKHTVFATLTAFALGTAGCNADTGSPMMPGTPDPGPSTGGGGNPDTGPDGPIAPQPVANYAGVYDVKSNLDFTQNGVLPGALGPALAGLSELHDHPGDALLTILKGANIPYVSDILNKVPSFLTSALAGLLDDLIINNVYKGYPVVDEIASIIMGITEISKNLDVHDTITVHTPTNGTSAVAQQLSALDFKAFGKVQSVKLTTAKLLQMSGTVTPHNNAPVADADLAVGAAMFELPMGELLLQAAGPLLFSQFGGAMDLNGALQNLVDCASFGQTLSDGLGGYIAPAEGEKLCAAGIGLVAAAVTQQIKAITFDGIEVKSANAKLYDVTLQKPTEDYQSDRIAEGKWTWTFTVGGKSASVPATFSGDRIGTAN